MEIAFLFAMICVALILKADTDAMIEENEIDHWRQDQIFQAYERK